jgi:hypothetical protein
MITVEEIRRKALNKYHQFLIRDLEKIIFNGAQCSLTENKDEPFFPLIIRSDKGNVNDDFSSRSKELAELIAHSKNSLGKGYTIEVKKTNSRLNAGQTGIEKIFFETEDDYLTFIMKKSEAVRIRNVLVVFIEQSDMTKESLYDWAAASLDDLKKEYENEFWQNIILCVKWFKNNPHSNLYIREIPLPVHTKFIESSRRIIHSLLSSERLVSFENQHGLRSKPVLVHFRALSKRTPLCIGKKEVSEVVLPLDDFADLPGTPLLDGIEKIFIVENEIVYLTFPEAEHALCIWGSGYEVAKLASCVFLSDYALYYFGDIDEHGFDMLSLYRSYFPKTRSFCMDEQTLSAFDGCRVFGKTLPSDKVPEHLTDDERAVFMRLRAAPQRNRLEQERISNQYLKERI